MVTTMIRPRTGVDRRLERKAAEILAADAVKQEVGEARAARRTARYMSRDSAEQFMEGAIAAFYQTGRFDVSQRAAALQDLERLTNDELAGMISRLDGEPVHVGGLATHRRHDARGWRD